MGMNCITLDSLYRYIETALIKALLDARVGLHEPRIDQTCQVKGVA